MDGYGTPTFVQKRHAAGGALYDMGVYHIAGLLYLLGNPSVARITGKTYQKTPMDAAREKDSGYDVEELGLGFVHFTNDITLDIIEAWAIHLDGIEGSSILGTLGGVRLEPFGFFHNIGDLEINSTADVSRSHTAGRTCIRAASFTVLAPGGALQGRWNCGPGPISRSTPCISKVFISQKHLVGSYSR